jgi:histidine triad (HIT) family protein
MKSYCFIRPSIEDWFMSTAPASCVFCRIITGQLHSNTVYSDNQVIAFLDIRPVNPGHTLVVPKSHAASLADLKPELGGRLFQVAMQIAGALRRSGLRCEGVNIYVADGKAAFQEVPHIHLHVIPRFQGDPLRLDFGAGYGRSPSTEELKETAAKIRQSLKTRESPKP